MAANEGAITKCRRMVKRMLNGTVRAAFEKKAFVCMRIATKRLPMLPGSFKLGAMKTDGGKRNDAFI
jgi:hypothetical protein